jgi:transposase
MNQQQADAAVAAHYALLLGIQSPWQVNKATLQIEALLVDIEIEHNPDKALLCPVCSKPCACYDHAPERTWRHLDVMQFTTQIRARLPRCHCPEHGVRTLSAPWAEPGSRFTLSFEAFALQVLNASASISAATKLLRLDWDGVQRIMQRAVERGLGRRSVEALTHVGLDEKSFGKGHDYVSLMTDLKGQRVLDVVPDRTAEAAGQLWERVPPAQRQQVQAAAMDMSAGYAKATRQAAPQAKIVYDRFHVSKHLNESVDKVRREEHQKLLAKGDESLKNTKYLWLQGAAVEGDKALAFSQLCERELKTARAWAHKEMFVEFWEQGGEVEGQRFFKQWKGSAMRTKLEPLKKVARMLSEHLEGLLNYFEHRITNALTEGFNSRIQAIKTAARGFRRFENYRIRILFYCGKLDLLPDLLSPSITH